jgi:hypothetical protein
MVYTLKQKHKSIYGNEMYQVKTLVSKQEKESCGLRTKMKPHYVLLWHLVKPGEHGTT